MPIGLSLVIAIAGGVVGLVLLIALANYLGQHIGGYFGVPLWIGLFTIGLAVTAYHIAIKPQFYVVVKQGEQQLDGFSIDKEGEFIYRYAAKGGAVSIDYTNLIQQLLATQDNKLCRDYALEQIGAELVIAQGALELCINKKGIW